MNAAARGLAWAGRAARHPALTLLLLGLLVLSRCVDQRHAADLARVCDLTGPHDTGYPQPLTDQQWVDRICAQAGPFR